MSLNETRRDFLRTAGILIAGSVLAACKPFKETSAVPTAAELFPQGTVMVDPHDSFRTHNFYFGNQMEYPVAVNFDVLSDVVKRYGLVPAFSNGHQISLRLVNEVYGRSSLYEIQPPAADPAGAWIFGGNMEQRLGHPPRGTSDTRYISLLLSSAIVGATATIARRQGFIEGDTPAEIEDGYNIYALSLADYLVAEIRP